MRRSRRETPMKVVMKFDDPCKCDRCSQMGEKINMVPVLGKLVHPMCVVSMVGEDGLCRLPYGAVKNIRRSDVGDRIIRKLLDAHA